jgi:DNA-binding SARP family transcriptional activator/TolB-like protein
VIRFHLLGALRLEAGATAARRGVLAQPKRTALLAYLALRAPRGPERRDALLGIFWPESDTNHARGALRNALHFLRVSLGPGAIRSYGSEEVQLDPDVVWCDAVEFERLLDAGDPAAALRLYDGDLLDGFYISDAPGFEQWLEAERMRLRQRAAAAAKSLAAEAERAGETGVALLRLRRLFELAPTDEATVRWLMRLLAAHGDRGEALRVYHELEQRLRDEYELEVEAETGELAASIRAAAAATKHAAQPAAAAEPVQAAAPSAETSPRIEAGPVPTPARAVPPAARSRTVLRWRNALVAAAFVAVVGALGVVLFRALGGEAPVSPDVVAVLPFDYHGGPEHAYLAEGIADLLATNLNGAGELRAVDPRALLPRLQHVGQPIQPALARREAAAHGAGLYVLGSIVETAGQLRIAATLHGLDARGRAGATHVVTEGAPDEVLAIVDRLTLGLLEGRSTTTLAQAALRTTHSVEALKWFLRGEAALRRADVHGAIEHYRNATALDSTFALAHYRLSSAAYRNGLAGIPSRGAHAALAHAGRLAREDSLLVAAWYHHVAGSARRAHGLYEEAIALRPSHVEAHFQLGELIFHWGAAIGVPAAEAAVPFSRVLAAEPHNVEAALHLARLAARDGRTADVDSLYALMHAAEPEGTWAVELDALRAFLSGDSARQDRAIEAAVRAGRGHPVLEAMAAYSYDLAAVERMLRDRVAVAGAPEDQARTQLYLVHVQLARGRVRAARRSIDAATAVPDARRIEYRAMAAQLPFLTPAGNELADVRRAIRTHPDTPLRDEGGPLTRIGIEYPHVHWPGMFRARRLYLLGALHIRFGDLASATAVADSLAREAPAEPLAARYERLTRARIAAVQGRPDAALRALGPPEPSPLGTFESLVDYDRPLERWLRAESLREAGRLNEALRWYATFPDPLARDLAFLAPAHLRRAEIHDAAGERTDAVFHYARFVELWRDADPELVPLVEQARARMRELTGGS